MQSVFKNDCAWHFLATTPFNKLSARQLTEKCRNLLYWICGKNLSSQETQDLLSQIGPVHSNGSHAQVAVPAAFNEQTPLFRHGEGLHVTAAVKDTTRARVVNLLNSSRLC